MAIRSGCSVSSGGGAGPPRMAGYPLVGSAPSPVRRRGGETRPRLQPSPLLLDTYLAAHT